VVARVRAFDPAPYLGRSPREIPSYSVSEAARYLRVPKSTVRAWIMGQGTFRPVIRLARSEGPPLLTFVNLVEVHVLDALRRQHGVSLPKVRRALRFLAKQYPQSLQPLAELDLSTDGLSVFVEEVGKLVNATAEGQLAMRRLLEAHLRRIEKDVRGAPIRLYPFTRKHPFDTHAAADVEEPRLIVIDPRVAFGRPALAGTGIPTEIIADRYKAGESIQQLAEDYDRSREEIEEAIRCELAA
jgi:uncharacterized protein (DUF433 family)